LKKILSIKAKRIQLNWPHQDLKRNTTAQPAEIYRHCSCAGGKIQAAAATAALGNAC